MKEEEDINIEINEAILNDVYLKNIINEKSRVYNMMNSPFLIERPDKRNAELMIEKLNYLIEERTNKIINSYDNSKNKYLK